MSEHSIDNNQRAYLKSLVCQRISDDPANRDVIAKFANYRNENLPYALKAGWNQDKKDKLAYYIVKEPGEDGEPLLFFSLKCGEIVVPFNQEKLRTAMEQSQALLDAAYGLDAPEWAVNIVEKRKVDGILPPKKIQELRMRHRRNLDKWKLYTEEIRVEGENIVRTKQTMAGVELVHLCIHTPARKKWAEKGMDSQGMGRTLFWQFVVPVIQQVRSLVGCEYIYLFAADHRKSGHLVNFYKDLGFEIREDLTVSKPEYDFCCYFMCQKVTALRNRRNEFFRNYKKTAETAKN